MGKEEVVYKYTHTHTHTHTEIKKKEILPSATMWMDLMGIF